MRKNIKLFILIIICSFLCANKVKAELINDAEGIIFKNSSDSNECSGEYCIAKSNPNMIIIEARLFYLNISDFENIGKTYYFVNTNAYNYLKNYELNLIPINAFNSYSGENRYQNAVNYLTNNYLNNETKVKETLNNMTGFNDFSSVLIKEIDQSLSKGYRILLEPALLIQNANKKTNMAIYTIKGISSKSSLELSSKIGIYYNQVIKIFDNNSNDSNIYLFNGSLDKCKGYNNQTLADYQVKCLYKMYSVDKYIKTEDICYKSSINPVTGLSCTNWDKNNEFVYEEKTVKTTNCTNKKAFNIYGKSTTFSEIGYCRLYCKEKLELSFPGNISIPEQKGTYFAWPSTKEGSQYKMQVKTTMDCTIVDDGASSTISSVMKRECDKKNGWYNNPDDPNKCITNYDQKKKKCPEDYIEENGICYKTVDPTGPATQNIDYQSPTCNPDKQYTINDKCYEKKAYNNCPSNGYVQRDLDNDGKKECYKIKDVSSDLCPGGKIVNGTCHKYQFVSSCKDGYVLIGGRCYKRSSVSACADGYVALTGFDGYTRCYKLDDSKASCSSGNGRVNGYCCQLQAKSSKSVPYSCKCYNYKYCADARGGTSPGVCKNNKGSYSPTCDTVDGARISQCCCYLFKTIEKCSTCYKTEYYCDNNQGWYDYDANHCRSYSCNAPNCSEGYTPHNNTCRSYNHINDSSKINCPSYYTYYATDNVGLCRYNYHTDDKNMVVCPSDTTYNSNDGWCLNNSYSWVDCGSGYTYDSASGKCRATTTSSCDSDYEPSGKGDGYCKKKISVDKTYCGSYTGNYNYSLKSNKCEQIVPDYCGTQAKKNYNYAIVNGKKICCQSGSEKTTNYSNKCKTKETKFKECPDGYYNTKINTNDGVCKKESIKPSITYDCKTTDGFNRQGTTCINPCTAEIKEKYINRMTEKLKNPKFEAFLKVDDSTQKIYSKLETYNIKVSTPFNVKRNEKTNQLEGFSIESFYNVKMNENINRFYNKITNEVFNSNNNEYYDRGEGVISLVNNIKIFGLNNTVNNYKLEINNFKNVGTDTTFDELLNKTAYVCQYRVTNKITCKCPAGTKNGGNSVYNLSAYINSENPKKIASNADVTKSCIELQEMYCDHNIEQEYCKKDNGEKVNITDCIINKNTTYEESYKICEKENCNPSDNYCANNCTYIDKKINNTVYTIQKCNNNTEICGFYLHCIDERETSQSYLTLLSQRLNTTNIVLGLRNNSINTSSIETQIKVLDKKICGIKKQPKVVYREIDLENPFPSKDGKSRTAGENFNSTSVINKVIKNGRGAIGNTLYNKDPILTITLTPNSIKKIREYNRVNKYTDNTLTCNGENVAGCISEFIHGSSDSSLKSMGVLNGISKCTNLNTSSSLSAFNSCYNSNN